ncbi:MAG: signal recognition particle protein [Candidatus Latescibacterota bacterium]|nr:MAG: signal recognition particle protein [Candidatus Latescibacterota bacterium]
MFEDLTAKLESAFRKLRGKGKLSDKDVEAALREIRLALLEADVHYKVVKDFLASVKERAIGAEVLGSLAPGQQVVKVVHDEMVRLLGGSASSIPLASQPPTVLLLVGLQGSGKTTAAAKLAARFKRKGKRPFLVAADVHRPAAAEQLAQLGRAVGCEVARGAEGEPAEKIAGDAVREARGKLADVVLVDTAGRLTIDEEMMAEVERVRTAVKPHEILLVVDGMTGQDAVQTATAFNERLGIDGFVLTKMDGDARGGAALSIRAVTGKPIKLVGVGEGIDALEEFHPDRMAQRILGMGDIVSLVERAEQAFDEGKAEALAKRLRERTFTLDDFAEQVRSVRKMGPLDQVLGMLPGAARLPKGLSFDEKAIGRVEAILSSMTPGERAEPEILNGSRRRRIARGSGTTVQEVNQILRQYDMLRKMMRRAGRGRRGGIPKGM